MALSTLKFAWNAQFTPNQPPNSAITTITFVNPTSKSETFGNEMIQFYLSATASPYLETTFYLHISDESKTKKISTDLIYRVQRLFTTDCYIIKENQEIEHGIPYKLIRECTSINKSSNSMSCQIELMAIFPYKNDFLSSWNVSSGFLNPVNHDEALRLQLATFGRHSSSSADVTIRTVANGREFKVHSVLLSIRSPVFAAMFAEGRFVEGGPKKEVMIEDIDGQVMEAFIAYLYGESYNGWEALAGELAQAAEKYDIQPLKAVCVASLAVNVTVDVAAKNFSFAHNYGMIDSMRTIAEYIGANKTAVMATDGWKEFVKPSNELLTALFELS